MTYSLHPETATAVEVLEKGLVLWAAEPGEAGNLKVGPEMAHVVAVTLHGVRVNVGQSTVARVGLSNLLGKAVLDDLGLLLAGLEEHFPETLGGDVVVSHVGRGVAEDVGDGLAELLDGNGEAVRLLLLNHLEEGVTEGVRNDFGRWGERRTM